MAGVRRPECSPHRRAPTRGRRAPSRPCERRWGPGAQGCQSQPPSPPRLPSSFSAFACTAQQGKGRCKRRPMRDRFAPRATGSPCTPRGQATHWSSPSRPPPQQHPQQSSTSSPWQRSLICPWLSDQRRSSRSPSSPACGGSCIRPPCSAPPPSARSSGCRCTDRDRMARRHVLGQA